MRKIYDYIVLTAAVLMSTAGFILIRNNLPAFSPLIPSLVLWSLYFSLFPIIAITRLRRIPEETRSTESFAGRSAVAVLYLAAAAGLIYMFVKGAVTDYYQPFSLYDAPIYLMLIAWLIFIVLFVIHAIRSLLGKASRRNFLLWPMMTLLLFAVIPVFEGLSSPEWTDSVQDSTVLFNGSDDGYQSYRIPGLLVLPAGSHFADGSIAEEDIVLAFAEARQDGSLDQGEIDLVLRRSIDSGKTWEDLTVVRRWEKGKGKIGDPTPVFDPARGIVVLAMGAQAHGEPYETWLMESGDGGQNWTVPSYLGTGSPGPGHGTILVGGEFHGRLVIPAHRGNEGFAWLSDNGADWRESRKGYQGNESLIAALGNGRLAYTARVPYSVAKPHPRLEKLFGYSEDGGDSWFQYSSSGVKTPICMSGLIGDTEGSLWFINPATVRTRGRLSMRHSIDEGRTWSDAELLYPGPAGYSDLALSSQNQIYVLAENGDVEYDERITFAIVPR